MSVVGSQGPVKEIPAIQRTLTPEEVRAWGSMARAAAFPSAATAVADSLDAAGEAAGKTKAGAAALAESGEHPT